VAKKAKDYREKFRKRVRESARQASRVRNDGYAGDYEVGLILAKINMIPTLRDYQSTKLIEAIINKSEKGTKHD
jgi:hypothetical protein